MGTDREYWGSWMSWHSSEVLEMGVGGRGSPGVLYDAKSCSSK